MADITYAIADMHGRYDLWSKAWHTILGDHVRRGEPDAEVVVLGDYLDRGPDSAKIVESLRFLHSANPKRSLKLIVLKGNHEDMAVQCCMGLARLGWWLGNGGNATLASYGYNEGDEFYPLKRQLKDDLEWMHSLPVYHDNGVQVFVHAYVDPSLPLEEQDEDYMMWHFLDRARYRDRSKPHEELPYPDRHVVHGHVQWAEGPILLPSRTDLDTWAYNTGRLAIGVFTKDQGPPVDILWAVASREDRL